MSSTYTEWSRKEKDEFARKKMAEMKLRNEQFKQRHAEVERDRIKAEEKNSSVTSLMNVPKEKALDEFEEETDYASKPKVKEREWDKGKSSLDTEEWDPHQFNPCPSNWRNYPDKRYGKKEDNWRTKSENVNKDEGPSRSRTSGRSWNSRKSSETSNQGAISYRNEDVNTYAKQRGRGYNKSRNSFENYRSFENSQLGESTNKKVIEVAGPASRSASDSEMDPMKQPAAKLENDRVWRMEGVNDVRHRQIRVEKWVKSISATNPDDGDVLIDKKLHEQEYRNKNWPDLEFQKTGDIPTEYIQGCATNNQECPPYDYSHSNRKNLHFSGNKSHGNERVSESKNQKEVKRKIFSEKIKPRRESNTSDCISSAKESDYHDNKNDNWGERSYSKSSDNSGNWETEDNQANVMYDDYFWKRSNPSKSSLTAPFSEKADKKYDMNDYSKSSIQNTSCKQWKNKSYSKNSSSSDYSGKYENASFRKQSDRRSNWKNPEGYNLRRSKHTGNKLKEDLNPSGSGTFENSEYDSSILVKIERHTVKRMNINNEDIDFHRTEVSEEVKSVCSDGIWADLDDFKEDSQNYAEQQNYEESAAEVHKTEGYNEPCDNDGIWADLEQKNYKESAAEVHKSEIYNDPCDSEGIWADLDDFKEDSQNYAEQKNYEESAAEEVHKYEGYNESCDNDGIWADLEQKNYEESAAEEVHKYEGYNESCDNDGIWADLEQKNYGESAAEVHKSEIYNDPCDSEGIWADLDDFKEDSQNYTEQKNDEESAAQVHESESYNDPCDSEGIWADLDDFKEDSQNYAEQNKNYEESAAVTVLNSNLDAQNEKKDINFEKLDTELNEAEKDSNIKEVHNVEAGNYNEPCEIEAIPKFDSNDKEFDLHDKKQFTESLEQGMELPKESTQLPEQGMELPKESTESPEQGMASPKESTESTEQGMESPKESTESPEQGMESPKESTESPVLLSEVAEQATKAPDHDINTESIGTQHSPAILSLCDETLKMPLDGAPQIPPDGDSIMLHDEDIIVPCDVDQDMLHDGALKMTNDGVLETVHDGDPNALSLCTSKIVDHSLQKDELKKEFIPGEDLDATSVESPFNNQIGNDNIVNFPNNVDNDDKTQMT